MTDEKIVIDVRESLANIAKLNGGLADSREQMGKTREAGRNLFGAEGAVREAQAIDALKKKYTEIVQAGNTLRTALKNAYDPRAITLYSKELAKLETAQKKIEVGAQGAGISLKNIGKEGSLAADVVSEAFGAISKATVILAVLKGVYDLAKGGLELASAYEKSKKQFEGFLGSAEKADQVLGVLMDTAARNFLDVADVNEAGKALLAFGEQAGNLSGVLDRVSDISAATGKNFNELATIYGKARTQGVLFAEDINQLTDAGIPIIQEFAKQLGVSTEEVKKLASEGKISFEELQLAFFNLTAEGGKFADQSQAQAETLPGLWKLTVNRIKPYLLELGGALSNLAKYTLETLNLYLNALGVAGSTTDKQTRATAKSVETLQEARDKALQAVQIDNNVTNRSKFEKANQALVDEQRDLNEQLEDQAEDRLKLEGEAEDKRAELAKKSGKAAAAENAKRLKEQEDYNRRLRELKLQNLDPESEAFAIAKENIRFEDQVAEFKKFKLDTEEIEKQHTKNLLRIQIEFYLERQAKIDKSIQDEKDSIQRGFDELASLAKDDAERKAKNNENVLRVRTQAEDLRAAIFEEQELSNKALFFSKERSDAEIEEYDKRVAKAREIFQLEQQAIALQNLIEFDKTLSSAEVATLETRVKNIQTEIGQLAAGVGEGKEKGKGFLQSLFPDFSGDELDQLKASLNQAKDEIFGFLQEVSDARLEAADRRLEAAEKEVEAAQLAYDKEKEIDDLGFANSLETAEKNLATAKANEEKALQLKREAQKKQLNLDAAMQASSLITAAANTFKGFSTIPLVGQILAVVSIAAMFAAFASAQAKARAAIKFREGGPVTGPSHERGGVPIEAEGGEFVTSRRATAQHFNLLEAVNKRDDPALDRWALGRVAKLDRVAVGQAIGEGKGSTTVIVQAKEDRKAHDLLRAIRDKRQPPATTVEGNYSVTRHNGRTVRKRIA